MTSVSARVLISEHSQEHTANDWSLRGRDGKANTLTRPLTVRHGRAAVEANRRSDPADLQSPEA